MFRPGRLLPTLLAAALLFAVLTTAVGQDTTRMYRIGYVVTSSPRPNPGLDAFRQELAELGYIEGESVIIEARFAEGRQERLPDLVAEVLRQRIDVLIAGSTLGALAAKKATTTVPIVFASVFDPVASGIVASLARPGGNITGATVGVGGAGSAGKWVELLKEAVPGVSHIAVLWSSANPASGQSVREIQAAAETLNLRLDVLDAGTVTNLNKAFAAIRASGAHGMIVTNDPSFYANRTRLVQFAASNRLPAVYFYRVFVDAGALMSYGGSLEDSYRRAARLVDKILKGAKPADLPVDQPTKFELVINLKTAKALGLTIPPSLLLRADQVIQ